MLWLSRSRPTKPQVANMRKYPLLMAGAMIGALLSFAGANAQAGGPLTNETWLCTDKTASDQDRPAARVSCCRNGYLTAQPLGAPRYRVLDSTPYGLIAADYSADLDLGFVSVYVATVMIDRVSGAFSSTLTASGSLPVLRTGQCRMQQAKAEPTVGASVADEVRRRQRLSIGKAVASALMTLTLRSRRKAGVSKSDARPPPPDQAGGPHSSRHRFRGFGRGVRRVAKNDAGVYAATLLASAAASTMSAHFSPIMIAGRVGVAGGQRRHDGGVGDAKPVDAVHLQFAVHHGHGVGAHLAGADRVIGGLRGLAHPVKDLVVGLQSARRVRSPRR